jgi:predicted  nucleic acid-binding Zn-ribbon protein
MTSPRNSSRGGTKTAVRPYASPSLEVIGQLEVANSLSQLEARLDSIEIDISRLTASRDADARHVTGEMEVMKARVEDALNAVTDTAQDLRDAWVGLDTKIADLVDGRIGEQHKVLEAIRAQLASGVESTRMAIEAAEARLQGEVEALSGTSTEQVRGVSELVEGARAKIDEIVAGVEGRVVEVMAGSKLSSGALGDEIQSMSMQLRDEIEMREKAFEERIGEITERVGGITSSFDTLMSKLAGTEARMAGGRAGTDAGISVLTQQVRALESRVADLSETIATTTTEKMQAMSGQVTEVREAILRVAERVGSTAFLTRRVADLEVRLAEVTAKVDRPFSI